ncbi:MAG: protein translocase subunit SecF [Spirochaetaceae bacterium]|jgi:preprotein translocase subunit SecF|nr:protein translocase subunit SecF [Spirochaetaceae bacterium]
MKRVIRFSRYFFGAAIFSLVLIAWGIAGYITKDGFNLGIDFKAGLIQEVRFAPTAFAVTYDGKDNATVSFTRTGMEVVISGPDTEGATYPFNFSEYRTLDSLALALEETVPGVHVETDAPGSIETAWFLQNAHGNPQINDEPYVVHYLEPGSPEIELADVRDSLSDIEGLSVQVLGAPSDRHFLIRVEDSGEGIGVGQDTVTASLEAAFGDGEVVVTRSDFVGSRFSQHLAEQAGLLMLLTLILILVYASVRFKPQFAIGAVIAIAHDALIMTGFIVWTRMEFNTTTIAAILTILGYSINDTIVVFDRIRETRRLYPDDSFTMLLDRAITETLGRTIITTLTTMLAVLSLYIFTSGSMKDFALALLVGMVSGVYSTIFIACGFADFWDKRIKKEKRSGAGQTVIKAAGA